MNKLFLWPRFHRSVDDVLGKHPPDVIELELLLSENMADIQKSLVIIMDACLNDIKISAKVDITDLTVGGHHL